MYATTSGKLSHIVRNPQTTDHCLAAYVIDRHGEKHKKQLTLVKHGLLCCQHVYPRLRGQLQTAWGNLKTWEEERVSRLRPPLPVPIWLNAVGLAIEHMLAWNHRKRSDGNGSFSAP